jgi:ribosomal protein L40E
LSLLVCSKCEALLPSSAATRLAPL